MGKYVISVFVEEHNHPLSSSKKVHLLRSHRNVSEAKKSLTQQFSVVNMLTHQQISILEFEAGGIENIGCTKKDIYNYEAKLCNEMRGRDAELLKEYFLTEQERDPSFMFEIDTDDECKLKHCFWSDSVCRRAYGCFGDVVVVDTTYNTNQYGIFTRISNTAFGNQNVWKSLKENGLLSSKRWVAAYVNHVFSTGMLSSQRAESSHAFFKRALTHQRYKDLSADYVDINEKPHEVIKKTESLHHPGIDYKKNKLNMIIGTAFRSEDFDMVEGISVGRDEE
ncbi:protein FAR1-RELATED SEQUENCE 5-like [Ziziphus jujuba]|uniref:Protein FAR1-RELATED SEQUENCE 5-like n=1 Tax=Ziziphus jujuba TaxID=326968 RepID=A0ABM4A2K2_ZIZJJ|nr:protein FAR1-RELATED SEQUENCE 5-like [Ziziphus jujuba]